MAAKGFVPPQDTFGPKSVDYLQRRIAKVGVDDFNGPPDASDTDTAQDKDSAVGNYAGAGSYF